MASSSEDSASEDPINIAAEIARTRKVQRNQAGGKKTVRGQKDPKDLGSYSVVPGQLCVLASRMTSLSLEFITRVAEAGFEIAYDPPPDGKCFYHAASHQIELSLSELIAVIFDYLKDHQFDENGDDRLAFLCETDLGGKQVPGTWPDALKMLENNYANSLVIQALADALHYKLVIITALGDKNFTKIIEPKGATEDTLFFGHTGNHYVALRPMDKHYEKDADGLCNQLAKPLKKKGGHNDFSVDPESFGKDVLEKVAVESLLNDTHAAQTFRAEASIMTGFAGSQDNDPSLTEATRISRGCSTSQEEEAMEFVYESEEKQSTSPMCTGETRSHGEFCEHHLFCKITLAVSLDTNKKKKKKTKKEDAGAEGCSTNADILKMCNALLNSGGGVLEMELTELQDDGTSKKDSVDSYWRKIEPSLREMIKPSSYDDVFDRCVLSNKIQLFLNAPKQFCTKNYNLYVPSDGSVLPASRDKVAEILRQKPQGSRREANSNVRVALKELPKVPEKFSCNEEFGLTESKQLQYKNYTSGNDLFANHSQREKICKQLSAFGNCDGGVALLGVTDDRQVQGVDLTKNSKDYVVGEIRSLVKKVCPYFEPVRGIHWDVAFHPVMESESHCVVVITMAGIQYSGGVFAKSPESYELRRDEAGKQVPRLLDYHEWKKRVDGARLPENSKGMNELLSKFEKMQISKGALFTIKGGVQRIRDSFFKVDEEFSISPKGAADNLSKEAQEVIHEIQRDCRKDWNRGLLVVSRSWLRDTGGKAIDGLICDVLVVSRNMGGLHLYTLCNTVDETSQNYSKEAAQAIKRSLQDNGARGQKFYVSFHVVSCCGRVKVESPLLDGRFPKSYDLEYPREKLNEILKAMVIGLTAVPSTLSSKVGGTILNLLTEEQFCLVHYMIDKTRELWVKGVAGTGKTLVAVEIIKKIRQRENLGVDEILYVCENEGIANHVRKSRSCTVVCRKTFLDSVFRQARHVIMDEVHNYEQPSGIESWYEKAKRIVRQHDPDRPGYLWFFIDLFQKSHEFPSGIPNEDQQQPQFRLTKIIRNSNKIFRRAKKVLGDVSKVEFDIGHDFEGEEVEEIPYIAKETSQIEVLKKVLQELLDKGYNHGDIAVLFLKKERIPFDDELSVALNDSPWMSAEGNDSDAIVVSTVLKYSGLDRPVLVLVDVKKTMYSRQLRPFLFSAVTRAMVKLIMIYEKK